MVAAAANVALIVGVKDNQPTLHQQIQQVSATTIPLGSVHSHDKGRNRDERRNVTVFDPADKLAETDWHPYGAAIIRVERDVYSRDVTLGEDRSRICNNPGVFARLRSVAFNILKAN